MFHLGYYWWLVGITNIYQNLGDLTRSGDFTWRVSDWWRHLRKHIGINESKTTLCMISGLRAIPPPIRVPASQPSLCTAPHQ